MIFKFKAVAGLIIITAVLGILGCCVFCGFGQTEAADESSEVLSESSRNYLGIIELDVLDTVSVLTGDERSPENLSDETAADETKAVETEADETEVVETEADETEAVETRADETEAVGTTTDETEAVETESDVKNVSETESDLECLFSDLFVTNDELIPEVLNIRDVPGGSVIGVLYPGSYGTVLDEMDGWVKITSGLITGWVSKEYILEGDEVFSGNLSVYIIVDSEKLMLRSQPSTSGQVLDVLFAGTCCTYISCEDGWVYVSYLDMKGYLSLDYVHAGTLNTAVSIEDYYAALTAEAEAEAETGEAEALEAEVFTEAETAAQTETETAAQTVAQTEAQTQTQTETAAQTQAETQSQALSADQEAAAKISAIYAQGRSTFDPIYLSASDIHILASVIMMEAGYESYEGKLAVAGVVLNRLRSGIWGNTLTGVVYAPGQFSSGTDTSTLDAAIAKGPNAESLQAAYDACAGIHNIGSYMYFCSLKSANYSLYSSYVVVDHQVFYQK